MVEIASKVLIQLYERERVFGGGGVIDIVFEKALIFDWMRDFQGIMFIVEKEILLEGFNILRSWACVKEGGGGG